MGIEWKIQYRLWFKISIVIPDFKSHGLIIFHRVNYIRRTGRSFLALLYTTVCNQNINKQILDSADENLLEHSFLSRFHFAKSKIIWKEHIEIVISIPVFIVPHCI